ncbi:hypothetical protein [Chroococcidiopsis sp. CCMEE 29]|uniref:hypothetical protein n=1 Tax=Chroococcidiopsis sp. CCMEE 29 TaxID=155894 RepID=UPI0031F8CC47
MNILLVLVSTLLLYFGGDVLVKNAARLALAIGMSPLVVGLTVVAFDTSSPERAIFIELDAIGQIYLTYSFLSQLMPYP